MSDEQAPVEEIMIQDSEDAAQEIEALKLEVAALKDQVFRYAADVENTKRRAEREMNDARAYAIQKFAKDLFGVSDNLGRALQAVKTDETAAASLGIHVTRYKISIFVLAPLVAGPQVLGEDGMRFDLAPLR